MRPCWRHIELEKDLPKRAAAGVAVVTITFFGVHQGVKVSALADDLAVWQSGRDIPNLVEDVQWVVDTVLGLSLIHI